MKTTTGTYGSGTTAENSLVANMLKYPEIARTLIQQHPRYTMTYLLEMTGRFAAEKIIGNNAFEWKVMGRYNKPSKSLGWISHTTSGTYAVYDSDSGDAAATGTDIDIASAQGDEFFVNFDHDEANGVYGDFLNKNDLVRFQSGCTAIVTSAPAAASALSASGNGLAVTTSDFKVGFTIVGTANLQQSDIAANALVNSIGTAFGQGSAGSTVGETFAYPDTYKNHLTLNRRMCSITGQDMTDVTWIENNGSRLWYFTREQQLNDEFFYQLELQSWYAKTSAVSADIDDFAGDSAVPGTDSNSTVTDANSKNVLTGDGLLAQIDSTNQASYTAGSLTENIITDFIGKISLNATAASGNEWVVMTGTEGRIAFHKAMKEMLVAPAGAMTGGSLGSVTAGADVELGANFTSYYALGNKITVAYCPVFDDPNLHSSAAGTNSFGDNRLKESAKMVFLDMGVTSGVSNIETITKGAEGYNRSFVKKYVPGMVNPYDQASVLSANGDDKFECHMLSERGIIVRNPLSCGILSVA